jgi:hypothetical protein
MFIGTITVSTSATRLITAQKLQLLAAEFAMILPINSVVERWEMGIRSLASLESAGARPGFRLVIKRDAEIPMPLDEALDTKRENLGCARGVLVALGFQAAALILGIGL